MSDGVSFMDILVQPIKQGIIELLNDAELNKNECKFHAKYQLMTISFQLNVSAK